MARCAAASSRLSASRATQSARGRGSRRPNARVPGGSHRTATRDRSPGRRNRKRRTGVAGDRSRSWGPPRRFRDRSSPRASPNGCRTGRAVRTPSAKRGSPRIRRPRSTGAPGPAHARGSRRPAVPRRSTVRTSDCRDRRSRRGRRPAGSRRAGTTRSPRARPRRATGPCWRADSWRADRRRIARRGRGASRSTPFRARAGAAIRGPAAASFAKSAVRHRVSA